MDCKEGIVESIDKSSITIRISRISACSACHAKGVCHSSDAREQLLTVTNYPADICVGERVRILLPEQKGLAAVLYAFVIPLILLVICATVLANLGWSETHVFRAVILLIICYYLLLALFRKRFGKMFELKVERI